MPNGRYEGREHMSEPVSGISRYNHNDTICAVATSAGKAALGVIKVSGPDAISQVAALFLPAKKKDIRRARGFSVHYGWIVDKSKIKNQKAKMGKKAKVVDEVLVTMMRKPQSYTRQDVVEISSHGGALAVNKIVELLCQRGVRLALPGEFTYRAFISGRIDLLQAQSIVDIVEAKNESALAQAAAQLRGEYSRKISRLSDEISEFVMRVEASLQFPEDEEETAVSDDEIRNHLESIRRTVKIFLEDARRGDLARGDIHCVICGKANVGKSTLFNRILRQERVIVTRTPGTTRDVIQEEIYIRGVALKMHDTAGILEPRDLIDKKAIEKSQRKIKEADLVLIVLDSSKPLGPHDRFLLDAVQDKNVILIFNKIDLPQRLKSDRLNRMKARRVKMSALKNKGMAALEKAVVAAVSSGRTAKNQDVLFLAQWQKELLVQMEREVEKALQFHRAGHSLDFIHFSLRELFAKMNVLTGKTLHDEVMDKIFTRFCIGK